MVVLPRAFLHEHFLFFTYLSYHTTRTLSTSSTSPSSLSRQVAPSRITRTFPHFVVAAQTPRVVREQQQASICTVLEDLWKNRTQWRPAVFRATALRLRSEWCNAQAWFARIRVAVEKAQDEPEVGRQPTESSAEGANGVPQPVNNCRIARRALG